MTYYKGQQTLRNKQNPWFAKQNHVKLAKNQLSKWFVDVAGVGGWNPWDELFPGPNNGQGLALDFSDISTLYTDETFSTNISAIGDPVGGVLDKSQGGVPGGELVTSRDFEPLSAWILVNCTASVTDGALTLTNTTTAAGYAYQQVATGVAAGDFFTYSVEHLSGSALAETRVDASPGNGTFLTNFSVGSVSTGFVATTNAAAMFLSLRVKSATAGATAIFKLPSLKELPGNHLIQATSTARPIWTRHPKSGVRNLFDGSDNPYGKLVIDNVARGSLGVDGVLSPAFSAASVQAYCRFVSAFAYAASTQHTFSATLTPQANGRYAWLATYDGTNDYGIMFDLSNGTVVGRRATADPEDDYGIEPSGSGYRVFVTFTSVASPSASIYSAQIGVSSDGALSFQSTFAGDEDVLIEDVQIEASALPTAYQTRVSQYNVTEAGVDDCYGLTFDGVDDYMVTAANLDLSGTDEITLVFGEYNNSNVAAAKRVFDLGGTSNVGNFQVYSPFAPGVEERAFATATGTTTSFRATALRSIPSYGVISAHADQSTPTRTIRADGADVDTVAGGAVGNFGSYALSVGSSFIGAAQFTGTLYGVTLTDYILDAEQLAALETWTAANTPRVLIEADNVYKNYRLEGGAPSGPNYGGASNPPTNHSIGFNTADSLPVYIEDEFRYEWRTNPAEDSARSYLTYDIVANHPDLQIGDTLRVSWEVQNLGGSSSIVTSTSSASNIDVTYGNRTVAVGQTVVVDLDVTITGLPYTGQLRVGTGVTIANTMALAIRKPKAKVIPA